MFYKVVSFYRTMKGISYTYTYITSLLDLPPTPMSCPFIGHHKALDWGPCAIQEVPTSCLFYRCVWAMSHQSCLTLSYSMDCSPPGSSVYGILQARILEWVAVPFSRYSPHPRIESTSPALPSRFFTTEPPRKPYFTCSSVTIHPIPFFPAIHIQMSVLCTCVSIPTLQIGSSEPFF